MPLFLTGRTGTATFRTRLIAGQERNWATLFSGYYENGYTVEDVFTGIDCMSLPWSVAGFSKDIRSSALLGGGRQWQSYYDTSPAGVRIVPRAEWNIAVPSTTNPVYDALQVDVSIFTRGDTVTRQYCNVPWTTNGEFIVHNGIQVWIDLEAELCVPWMEATRSQEIGTHLVYLINHDQPLPLRLSGTWSAAGQASDSGSSDISSSGVIDDTIDLSGESYGMWGDFGWGLAYTELNVNQQSYYEFDDTYSVSVSLPDDIIPRQTRSLSSSGGGGIEIDGTSAEITVQAKSAGSGLIHEGVAWIGSLAYGKPQYYNNGDSATFSTAGGYSVSKQARSYTIDTSDIRMADGSPADLLGVQIAFVEPATDPATAIAGLSFEGTSPEPVTFSGEYTIGGAGLGNISLRCQRPTGAFSGNLPVIETEVRSLDEWHEKEVPSYSGDQPALYACPTISAATCNSRGWFYDNATVGRKLVALPGAIDPKEAFSIDFDENFGFEIYKFAQDSWLWDVSNLTVATSGDGLAFELQSTADATGSLDITSYSEIQLRGTLSGHEGSFRYIDMGVDWSFISNRKASLTVTLGSSVYSATWILRHGQSVIDLANPYCHPEDGYQAGVSTWGNAIGRTAATDFYDGEDMGNKITTVSFALSGAAAGETLHLTSISGLYRGGETVFNTLMDESRYDLIAAICHQGVPSRILTSNGYSGYGLKDNLFDPDANVFISGLTYGPTAYSATWNDELPEVRSDSDRILDPVGSPLYSSLDTCFVYPLLAAYSLDTLSARDIEPQAPVPFGDWVRVLPKCGLYASNGGVSCFAIGAAGTPSGSITMKLRDRIGWNVHGVSIRNRRHASVHIQDPQSTRSFMVTSDGNGVFDSLWLGDRGDLDTSTQTPAPSANIWPGVSHPLEITGSIHQDDWPGWYNNGPRSSVIIAGIWSEGVPEPVCEPVEPEPPELPELPPPPIEPPFPPSVPDPPEVPPSIPPAEIRKYTFLPDDTLYRRVVTAACTPVPGLVSDIRAFSDNRTPGTFRRETEWYLWRADFVVHPESETTVVVDSQTVRRAASEWDFFSTSDAVWYPGSFAEKDKGIEPTPDQYVYLRNIDVVTETVPNSGSATPIASPAQIHPDSPVWYKVPSSFSKLIPQQLHWIQVGSRDIVYTEDSVQIEVPYDSGTTTIDVRYRSMDKFTELNGALSEINGFIVPIRRIQLRNTLDELADIYSLKRNQDENNATLAVRLREHGIITSLGGRRAPTFSLANALDLVVLTSWSVTGTGQEELCLDLEASGVTDITDVWIPSISEVEGFSETLVRDLTYSCELDEEGNLTDKSLSILPNRFIIPSKRSVDAGYNISVGGSQMTDLSGVTVSGGAVVFPSAIEESVSMRYTSTNYRTDRDSNGYITRLRSVPHNTPLGNHLVICLRRIRLWEPGSTEIVFAGAPSEYQNTITQLTESSNKAAPVALGFARWDKNAVWFDEGSPSPAMTHFPVTMDT